MISSSAWSVLLLISFFPAELVKVIEGVVPHIVGALKDTNLEVRDCAVEALGKISKQRE